MNRHDRRAASAGAPRYVSQPVPQELRIAPITQRAVDPTTGVSILGQEPEHGVMLVVPHPQTFFSLLQADLVTDGFVRASNISRVNAKLDRRRFVCDVDVPEHLLECIFTGSGFWGQFSETLDDKDPRFIVEEADKVLDLEDVEAEAARWSTAHDALVKGEPAWPGWHIFDPLDAYIAGCKRWGLAWWDDSRTDASRYDIAVQLAVFGEVRYG